MAVKDREEKSYNYRKYFEKNRRYIVGNFAIIFKSKNLQIFN